MRISPLGTSNRKLEKDIESRAMAVNLKLSVELTQEAQNASALIAFLSKQASTDNTKTRPLILKLIQLHFQCDIYAILRDSCQLVQDFAKRLSLHNKTIPNDKHLLVAMSNTIYSSLRLKIPELRALCELFRNMFGDKYFTWTSNNQGKLTDDTLVKKLEGPIDETLVQKYMQELIKPPTVSMPVKISGQPNTNIRQPQKPKQTPKLQPQPTKSKNVKATPSSTLCISKLAPVLPIRIIRPNARLEIAFDVRTKNPVYSLEKLDVTLRNGPVPRRSFFEEERLPPEYRSRLCSFISSGYDRGHLAPAADFGCESVKDTFNLCNVSPQNQSMNRSIWQKLEHWCRRVAREELSNKSRKSAVYIVTGPVWLPRAATRSSTMAGKGSRMFEFETIGEGDSLIHVPTHFFKTVAIVENNSRIERFACFLVPNLKQKPDARLEDYVVSWDRLETLSGLQLFPLLVDSKWKKQAKNMTHSLMSVGKAGARMGRPSSMGDDALARAFDHLNIQLK